MFKVEFSIAAGTLFFMVALIHTIWGELDEGDGRVIVVNERL